MRNRIAAGLAAAVLLLPLASCAQTAQDRTAAEQTAMETKPVVLEPVPDNLVLNGPEDRANFLSACGFTDGTVPFYRFYNEDGTLRLEFFYDTALWRTTISMRTAAAPLSSA